MPDMSAVEKRAPIQHELLDVSYDAKVGTHDDAVGTYVARIAGEKIKVTVRANSYEHQSYAKAELLAADKSWSLLCTEPPAGWHAEVRYQKLRSGKTQQDVMAALDEVAGRLFIRAERIVS